MEKFGFVYIWHDQEYNRFYIGSHWGLEDDGYVCSSKAMREAYRRRKGDFKRRIVSRVYTDRKELLETEQRWLDLIKPEEFGKRYYNKNAKVNGYYWWINENTKSEVSRKVSETRKRKGLKAPNKTGIQHTKETKEKIGQAVREQFENGTRSRSGTMKGRKHSEATKLKMSEASKGKPKSEAHKDSLRLARKRSHAREVQGSEAFSKEVRNH